VFEEEVEKFMCKNIKKILFVDYTETSLYKHECEICEIFLADPITFKKKIIGQLFDIIVKLKHSGIIHRDIHYDNIILINGDATLIDFGCAKPERSDIVLLRGSLRYYSCNAILDKNYYNNDCDLYMCSFVVYELIEEHEIYPELKGDTEKIIEMRLKKIYPVWSDKAEGFKAIIDMIHEIWEKTA